MPKVPKMPKVKESLRSAFFKEPLIVAIPRIIQWIIRLFIRWIIPLQPNNGEAE